MFYNASPGIFQKAEELRNNMTEAEKVLWTHLRKSQLGVRFKAQHPIDKFIADFYCHKAKLVVEVDGSVHDLQKEYDQNRSDEINNLGVNVIRFTNEEVFNDIEKVVGEIKKRLK
jgi:very-short-patch-repair endonuclease